jgi:hypothetical protein
VDDAEVDVSSTHASSPTTSPAALRVVLRVTPSAPRS